MRKRIGVTVAIVLWCAVGWNAYAYKADVPSNAVKAVEERQEDVKAKKDAKIMIYDNDTAPNPYVIIGKLAYQETVVVGTCEDKLAKYASKKHGADAILKFNVIHAGMCEGVAVRWAKDGEDGLTAIDDKTPIPVIKGKKRSMWPALL